ncbi:hypothetical protein SNEBB_007526 [Seison nebaliae]|nr:hypothetical protein SNEBB_007526 [Seison nebaliae]
MIWKCYLNQEKNDMINFPNFNQRLLTIWTSIFQVCHGNKPIIPSGKNEKKRKTAFAGGIIIISSVLILCGSGVAVAAVSSNKDSTPQAVNGTTSVVMKSSGNFFIETFIPESGTSSYDEANSNDDTNAGDDGDVIIIHLDNKNVNDNENANLNSNANSNVNSNVNNNINNNGPIKRSTQKRTTQTTTIMSTSVTNKKGEFSTTSTTSTTTTDLVTTTDGLPWPWYSKMIYDGGTTEWVWVTNRSK